MSKLKTLVRLICVGVLLTMGIGILQAQEEIRPNTTIEASLRDRAATFIMNLDAGTALSVQAVSLTTNLSPQISILSPSMAEVANSSNSRQGLSDAKSALVNFTAPTKGRYLIMVSSQTGQVGTFELTTTATRLPSGAVAPTRSLRPTAVPPTAAPPVTAPNLLEPCRTFQVLEVIPIFDIPNGAPLTTLQEYEPFAYARSGDWWLISPENQPLYGWYLPENPTLFQTPRCNLLPIVPPFSVSAQRQFAVPTGDADSDGLPDPIDACPAYAAFDACFYSVELDSISPLALAVGETVSIPVNVYAPSNISSFIPPGNLRYEVAVDDAGALGLSANSVPSAILADYVQLSSSPGQPITVTLMTNIQAAHLVVTWYDAASNNHILAQDDMYIALASSPGGENLICQTQTIETAALLDAPGGTIFATFLEMDFRVFSTSGGYALVGVGDTLGWLPLAQITFANSACNALPVVGGFNVLEPLYPDVAFNDLLRDSDLDGLPTAYDLCPDDAANACETAVVGPEAAITPTAADASTPAVTATLSATQTSIQTAPADRDYQTELTPKVESSFSEAVSFPDGDTADTIVVNIAEGEANYLLEITCTGDGTHRMVVQIPALRQAVGCNSSLPVFVSAQQPLTLNIGVERGDSAVFAEYTLVFKPQ